MRLEASAGKLFEIVAAQDKAPGSSVDMAQRRFCCNDVVETRRRGVDRKSGSGRTFGPAGHGEPHGWNSREVAS